MLAWLLGPADDELDRLESEARQARRRAERALLELDRVVWQAENAARRIRAERDGRIDEGPEP